VTGVAGVGVGASRSLPGQPFYGVKRTVEGMQLATTVGTEARGKRHLEFARTRLAELRALAGTQAALAPAAGAHAYAAAVESGGTRSALIAQTLRDMDNETRDGANDLFAAYRSSGDTEPLKALTTFTTTQFGDLHGLVPALPETVRPAASGSLLLLTVVTTDTLRLVGVTPGSGKTPTGPAPSSTGVPATNGGSTQPSGNGAGTTTQSGQPQPQPTQSQRQNNQVVPPPVLPTIPPVLPPLPTATPTAAPNQAPTLPDVTGLLGH
jgi:hypothetical protein